LLFLYKRVTKNKTRKKEWRERKGLLESLPFIYFVLFFSVELLFVRDTVSVREFLVCLQEQMKFEGIFAAFKRNDAADFLFLFWLSRDRKRKEGRCMGLLHFFSPSHGLSLSRSDSLCLSARERLKGRMGKKENREERRRSR
jgi:hypothetical protein